MSQPATTLPTRSASDGGAVVQAVTVIMGIVVGLTFLFGFGNVLTLGLRLGVPIWVAPLVAPAVDLSILGLLLGTRQLALHGATAAQLRPARRLLIFASLTTLALNIADPLVVGAYGKAAFDAVGPLLLIGWAEVGPSFLQAINALRPKNDERVEPTRVGPRPMDEDRMSPTAEGDHDGQLSTEWVRLQYRSDALAGELLARARQEDADHRVAHQRPISAETLRKRLQIGAARSRQLVALVRAEAQPQASAAVGDVDIGSEGDMAEAA